MNAAIRAVAKLAASQGVAVHGALEGYDGLIDGRFRELTKTPCELVRPPDCRRLART
ncbi:MAG: 6-phosphofructokinase [Myxococcaceae bacterium]|jgi:6-phosphofructokinase|nr:6-phosphofructokinase [Myxococcaceae bacterium]